MSRTEIAALVALLQRARRAPEVYAELIEQGEDPRALLAREQVEEDDGQQSLLAAPGLDSLLEQAQTAIENWEHQGMTLVSISDSRYPINLRGVHDRPPLIFVAGTLTGQDSRSVAVIGSRSASEAGQRKARLIAGELTGHGYTIVSGLAAGIDTAAHTATLDAGGRTVAVIGTGLLRSYPAANAELQRAIAGRGAVVSQFWPETGPRRENFPLRNATMSGLSLATVIVEASARSGARIQARLALGHGRRVFLESGLLSQEWAAELAARPAVTAFTEPGEISAQLDRLASPAPLTPEP